MLSTPVLLIVFNRPEIAKKALYQISLAKPKYLYIAADGPRHAKPDDIQKCAETREIVKQIDWQCELKTLFQEENKGCGYGPAEAISWFFSHVEQGIILEDDCLPSPSFFNFCEELLIKYKNDERIGIISGFNKMPGWKKKSYSYTYSFLGDTWGWAGWRRSWQLFDYKMSLWNVIDEKDKVKKVLKNDHLYEIISKEFNYCANNDQNHIWDCQWLFARLVNSLSTIIPNENLIQNVGFGPDATHTFTEGQAKTTLKASSIQFPLVHHEYKIDRLYERIIFERFLNPNKILLPKKILLKCLKIIYRVE
ncbi:hypothetical protein [Spirosoma aerolatum]|uniref:hypothetical protein n=1 Tax=Spirosoma aerolatum TaxID=1211326 RepID=UPI0009AE8F20|nr:hypothetical protein [Spirosoma aerolatum]